MTNEDSYWGIELSGVGVWDGLQMTVPRLEGPVGVFNRPPDYYYLAVPPEYGSQIGHPIHCTCREDAFHKIPFRLSHRREEDGMIVYRQVS